MTDIYDQYKKTNEWALIQKAVRDLISNQDIILTTMEDYVVGYITKQLVDQKKNFT